MPWRLLVGKNESCPGVVWGIMWGAALFLRRKGDIFMKLAREALDSADLPDCNSLFADEVVVSISPMGCPTAPSALLPVPETPKTVSWSDWMTNKGVAGRVAGRVRPKQATQNQVTLF